MLKNLGIFIAAAVSACLTLLIFWAVYGLATSPVAVVLWAAGLISDKTFAFWMAPSALLVIGSTLLALILRAFRLEMPDPI